MIHYALRCDAGHEFNGWFPGSAAFDAQCSSGQIECPSCSSVRVARALMAPAVSARSAEPMLPVPAPAPKLPAEMVAAMQKLRQAVERNCDYVGPDFADHARRMHRGEIESRAIYGETSAEQAEALQDEGVEIARVPWITPADS